MLPTVENDFVIRSNRQFNGDETITFKYPTHSIFERAAYDWYIIVAIEKADKCNSNRHELTRELLLEYRWAIREGYNHCLDKNIKNPYDQPRNKNTIEGIK